MGGIVVGAGGEGERGEGEEDGDNDEYVDDGDDVYYAAKFVVCYKREDRRNVEREVEIMNKLNDPKLLFLFDAFDNGRNELCLVTE